MLKLRCKLGWIVWLPCREGDGDDDSSNGLEDRLYFWLAGCFVDCNVLFQYKFNNIKINSFKNSIDIMLVIKLNCKLDLIKLSFQLCVPKVTSHIIVLRVHIHFYSSRAELGLKCAWQNAESFLGYVLFRTR